MFPDISTGWLGVLIIEQQHPSQPVHNVIKFSSCRNFCNNPPHGHTRVEWFSTIFRIFLGPASKWKGNIKTWNVGIGSDNNLTQHRKWRSIIFFSKSLHPNGHTRSWQFRAYFSQASLIRTVSTVPQPFFLRMLFHLYNVEWVENYRHQAIIGIFQA